MKSIFFMGIISMIFYSCTYTPQKLVNKPSNEIKDTAMKHFELTPETAHPKAKALMTEDFYWSPIEETGPFGSDDGSDAFYGFHEWRSINKTISPIVYLHELIERWGYPPFELNTIDNNAIKAYTSRMMGETFLRGQDNAIIAVGFGQFVLEGKVDEDLKTLTQIAIKRELLPVMIDKWDDPYKKTRKDQLTKMLNVLDKVN